MIILNIGPENRTSPESQRGTDLIQSKIKNDQDTWKGKDTVSEVRRGPDTIDVVLDTTPQ